MNKNIFLFLLACCPLTIFASRTITVSVTNPMNVTRADVPIIINLTSYGTVCSALVTQNGQEIPCQLDDLDKNETFDELCFLADIDRKDKKKIIRNIIIYAIAIVFIGAVNIGYNKILQPHQRQRIDTILGKTSDPKGADFNLIQSKIAIGSGGFFGKGYLNGTQTKLNFVPEQSTDFIFCAIGEEWGFVGSCALGALFLSLVIRILRLAEKNRNPYARYYGYGIAGIIAFHFFINIGMTVGLVPIIGIPLPFISYGGSSLWAFTAMLFIFIKLNDN